MIVWKRYFRTYDRDIEERDDLAWNVASPITYKSTKCINVIINIIAFLITFCFFKFNLLAYAITFILLDIAMCILDRLVFMTIPSNHPANTDVEAAQKRFKKIERAIERTKLKKDKARYGGFIYELSIDELRWLQEVKEEEEKFINSELEKIKKTEIKQDKRISKDYSNKKEYFVVLYEKFSYLISENNYDFLKDICVEIKELLTLLDKKPIGYELIPHNLYLHLDELLLVLTKYSELDAEQKSAYIKDISMVTNYLKRNIESLSKRISDLETEDIEISLAVLLKELSKGEDKNV